MTQDRETSIENHRRFMSRVIEGRTVRGELAAELLDAAARG